MTDEVKDLLNQAEMILVGIGSQMTQKSENVQEIDRAYRLLAAFLKGKNYFVISTTTDGKLITDGIIYSKLTVSPRMEGQEKNWRAYMNWLSGSLGRRLVILELGEDFSNPQLMRWPFEQVVKLNTKAVLIRVGTLFPQIPKELEERAISIREKPCQFIEELS